MFTRLSNWFKSRLRKAEAEPAGKTNRVLGLVFRFPGDGPEEVAEHCRKNGLVVEAISFDRRPLPAHVTGGALLFSLRCRRNGSNQDQYLHFWTDSESHLSCPATFREELQKTESRYFSRTGLPEVREHGEPSEELIDYMHYLAGLYRSKKKVGRPLTRGVRPDAQSGLDSSTDDNPDLDGFEVEHGTQETSPKTGSLDLNVTETI